MSLTRAEKELIVQEVAESAAKAPSIVAANYTGLTATEITELRKSARAAGVRIWVVRNTLARRAFEGTNFDCMKDGMLGQLLLAFSNDEPGSAARIIRDFSNKNQNVSVRLIALDGNLLDPSDLEKLANMPSLNEARSMLLGVLRAPHGKFLRTAVAVQAGFMRLLAARRDKQADLSAS